jgi:hypothetical protein
MSRPTRTAKVLRIAVLCDGRIVTERLIAADSNVRIGTHHLNDLVLTRDAFGTCTTLFAGSPAGYALTTLPDMHGKVTVHSEPASIRALVADGVTSLSLSQDDRGKLVVGDITVLFQFVAPPPTAAHLLGCSLDFRPRLFEEDDPIFVGATAIFTGLAAVLLGWVYTSPPPPIMDFIELDPRIGRVFLQAPRQETPLINETPDARLQPAPTAPEEPEEPEIADIPADNDGVLPDGRRLEDLTQDEQRDVVANNPLMIALMHGMGANAGPAAGGLFDDDDHTFRDLDEAMENVTGVQVAEVGGDTVRGGEGIRNDDIDIGELDGILGGSSELTDDVTVALIPTVTSPEYVPEPDIDDPQAIQDAVEANHGRLVTCYDRELKNDPNLQGRVDIEFFISQGRVTQAQVFADTTHNSAFTACLADAIRRIRFPAGTTGEVVFPFIFSARN